MKKYKVYFNIINAGVMYVKDANKKEVKTLIKAFSEKKVVTLRGEYFNMNDFISLRVKEVKR